MKGKMDDLWAMYFSMQLLCYLELYEIPMPGSAMIYNNEFIKIIEFKLLNPEGIIGLFVSDFTFAGFIQGIKVKSSSD